MNSFTRIGLPIILVIVAVFLITVVNRYTADSTPAETPETASASEGAMKYSKEPPIKFFSVEASMTDPDKAPKHLKYWNAEAEVNEAGYYDFWASNKHDQPVTIRAVDANCQCAGVEVANPKPQEVVDFLALTAIANSPLMGGVPMPAAAAVAEALFASKLEWKLIYNKDTKSETEIPAAGPTGPQVSIVKMNWGGRATEGPRRIYTRLVSNLPNATQVGSQLDVNMMIVPSCGFLARTGDVWTPLTELQFGDIRDNGELRQEFFVVSSNRLTMDLVATVDGVPTPCITVSPPVRATPDEVANLLSWAPPKGGRFINRVGSMYKVVVNVKEKAATETGEVRQLDLGVLDRRLRVENGEEHRSVMIRGRTLGDIRILAGADSGRIDVGSGFPAEQTVSKVVTLIAERPGLDVTLLSKEVVPNYLKVKLEPQKDIDGRKNWRLSVVVPGGSLYGSLPPNSVIMLITNDPIPRRIRLPIIGTSLDTGAGKP